MRPPERSTWGNILRGGLDFAGGALFQVPTHALRLGEDIAGFGGMLLPGRDPLEVLSEGFQDLNELYEDKIKRHGPQGKAATAGALVAELGLTGLSYAGLGGALRGVAATSRLRGVSRLGKRSSNILGEAAKDALAVAPLDAVYAAKPETSVTTLAAEMLPEGSAGQRAAESLGRTYMGRLAGEMALGGAADVLLRGVGGGLRGAKDIVTGQPVRSPLSTGFTGIESVNPEIEGARVLEELRSRPLERADPDLAPIEPGTAVPVAEEPIPTPAPAPADVQPPETRPRPKLGGTLKPYATGAARVGAGLLGAYGVMAPDDGSDTVSGLALAGAAVGMPKGWRRSAVGRFGMRSRAGEVVGEAAKKLAAEGLTSMKQRDWKRLLETMSYGEKEWTGVIGMLDEFDAHEQVSIGHVSKYLEQHGLRLSERVSTEGPEQRALVDEAMEGAGQEARAVIRGAKDGAYDSLFASFPDPLDADAYTIWEVRQALAVRDRIYAADPDKMSNSEAIDLAYQIDEVDKGADDIISYGDLDDAGVDRPVARDPHLYGSDDPLRGNDWGGIGAKLDDERALTGLEYGPRDQDILWTEGGDEFKEIKIILQRKRPVDPETGDAAIPYGRVDPKTGERPPDPSGAEPHTDEHWDEEDVLLHLRLHTRMEPTGKLDSNGQPVLKKVLFVEEIQSDWHQRAQKEGFAGATDDPMGQQRELDKASTEATNVLMRELEAAGFTGDEVLEFTETRFLGTRSTYQLELDEGMSAKLDAMPQETRDKITAAWEAHETAREAARDKEGWSPYAGSKAKRTVDQAVEGRRVRSGDWLKLGWKRIMDEAVSQNVDAVAWTPGIQQAARNQHTTAQVADQLRITPHTDDPTDAVKGKQRFTVSVLRGGFEERDAFGTARGALTASQIKQAYGVDVATRIKDKVADAKGRTDWELIVQGEELATEAPQALGWYDKDVRGSIVNYLSKEFGITIDPKRDLALTSPGMDPTGPRLPIKRTTEKVGWETSLEFVDDAERVARKERLAEAEKELAKLRLDAKKATPGVRRMGVESPVKATERVQAAKKVANLVSEISLLRSDETGRLRPEDWKLRDKVWSFDLPDALKGEGEAAKSIRAGETTLLTPPPVVGGALGAAFGATQEAQTDEERGQNILKGAISGAMLGGGVSAMKGLRGRARSTKSIAAKRRRDPIIGDTDAAVVETLGPGSATAETIDNMAPSAAKDAAKGAKKESLLGSGIAGWWNRMRQGVSRSVLALEMLDVKAKRADKPVTTAAGVARGFVTQAEPFIQEMLGSVIREHKPHLKLAAALAHADRWIEIHTVYGAGKVTAEQLERAVKTRAEIEGLPAEQYAGIKEAADSLTGYYRQLIDLKHKAGIYTDAQHTALTEKGASYVPFLPQDLVEKSDEAYTSLADIYRLNTSTGTRKMSDQINEALLVDPWEQAVRDTYETFRRIARQNLTNTVTGLVQAHPELHKYVKIYESKPRNIKREELLTALGPVTKTDKKTGQTTTEIQQIYYHVTDPDLHAAWSAIDINVGKIGLVHHANTMRKFMQAGVTLNPTFTARNGIRDYVMSAVQTRLNEGVPVLGLVPPTVQVAGAAAIGAATAEEGEEVTGALSGMALIGGTHLARHSLRVAAALNDILGPHNIGMAVGGVSGYFSTTDDEGFGDTIINMGTGAALGRTAGALGSVVGLRGSKTALRDFHKAGAGQFGFYSANVEDSKRMMQDMLDSGVDPADLIHAEGFGDAIRLIMQPINALLNLPKRGMKGVLWDSWVQPIKEFGKAVETAPRLAHFKRLRGKGVAADQAAFSARDLSLDFQIHGSFASTQVFIQTTPFLNPMLLGADKLGRMMLDKDVWAPVAATMIAPSVLLWQLNHSDKEIAAEYESRPEWERNSFWLLPKKVMHKLGIEEKQSGFYRVPKPFELGFVYASIPERMLSSKAEYDEIGLAMQLADWQGEVGDTMLDFMGSFVSPSLPMPIGGWAQTAMGEHGHSLYQNRPINPLPWMNIPQEQQETPYTSWIASIWHDVPVIGELSAAVGISSPAKVDFMIRNYLGSLGAEAARALTAMARNQGLDQRPEAPKGQRYGFRDFQTSEQLVTQHESDFREAYDETEEAWNALQLGMRNDPTKVNLLLRDMDFRDNIARYQMGRDMKNTVDKLTALRRQIRFGAGLGEDTKARASIELTGAIAGVSSVYKQARIKMDRRLREAREPSQRRRAS